MRKRELEERLREAEGLVVYYRDGDTTLVRMYKDQALNWMDKAEKLSAQLATAQDDLFIAQATADLYVEAACLPSYHTHPLTCPMCGSDEVDCSFHESKPPDARDRFKGQTAHLWWYCGHCGANFAYTKTLEAS